MLLETPILAALYRSCEAYAAAIEKDSPGYRRDAIRYYCAGALGHPLIVQQRANLYATRKYTDFAEAAYEAGQQASR